MLALLDFDKFLTFTIIGLSTGAIYAVVAGGLVVTYTTSGIFNLAHGATGPRRATGLDAPLSSRRGDAEDPSPVKELAELHLLREEH